MTKPWVVSGALALLALAAPAVAIQQTSTTEAAAVGATAPVKQLSGAPTWERLPEADQIAGLYPRKARDQQVAGRAVMRCLITKEGRLRDCAITEETPAGWGFGEATLRAARFFKLRPTTSTGASVEGGTIVVPLNWRVA